MNLTIDMGGILILLIICDLDWMDKKRSYRVFICTIFLHLEDRKLQGRGMKGGPSNRFFSVMAII
jgi:hypothetical protein